MFQKRVNFFSVFLENKPFQFDRYSLHCEERTTDNFTFGGETPNVVDSLRNPEHPGHVELGLRGARAHDTVPERRQQPVERVPGRGEGEVVARVQAGQQVRGALQAHVVLEPVCTYGGMCVYVWQVYLEIYQ